MPQKLIGRKTRYEGMDSPKFLKTENYKAMRGGMYNRKIAAFQSAVDKFYIIAIEVDSYTIDEGMDSP